MVVVKSCLVLLLADVSFAIRVFLHPSPANVAQLPPVLSPTQARAVVSSQLRLDAYDSFEDVDNTVGRIISDGSFVGQGPRSALLLTVSEDVSRGECLLIQRREL